VTAAQLDDAEGHALVEAIHERKNRNTMETMSHESSGICWCGPNNHGPDGVPAAAVLGGIKSRLSQITPGQWKAWDRGIGYEVHSQHDEPLNTGHRETFTKADAVFIAAAPTDVARLTGALEAVLALHYAGDMHGPAYCKECSKSHWIVPVPCPTVAAIEIELAETPVSSSTALKNAPVEVSKAEN
jgi:hypothetical protein